MKIIDNINRLLGSNLKKALKPDSRLRVAAYCLWHEPDWDIPFREGALKHVCIIPETPGSISSMELRQIEVWKINCARKDFGGPVSANVKHDIVSLYGERLALE